MECEVTLQSDNCENLRRFFLYKIFLALLDSLQCTFSPDLKRFKTQLLNN